METLSRFVAILLKLLSSAKLWADVTKIKNKSLERGIREGNGGKALDKFMEASPTTKLLPIPPQHSSK